MEWKYYTVLYIPIDIIIVIVFQCTCSAPVMVFVQFKCNRYCSICHFHLCHYYHQHDQCFFSSLLSYVYIYATYIYIYIYIHTRLYRLYICIYNDYIDICVTMSDMMLSSISKCQALRLRGLVLLAVGSPGKVRVSLVASTWYQTYPGSACTYIYITCSCNAIAHSHNTHRYIYIYTDALIQVHISWNWSGERIAHFFSETFISFFQQTPEVAALLGLWNSTSFVGNGLPGAPYERKGWTGGKHLQQRRWGVGIDGILLGSNPHAPFFLNGRPHLFHCPSSRGKGRCSQCLVICKRKRSWKSQNMVISTCFYHLLYSVGSLKGPDLLPQAAPKKKALPAIQKHLKSCWVTAEFLLALGS